MNELDEQRETFQETLLRAKAATIEDPGSDFPFMPYKGETLHEKKFFPQSAPDFISAIKDEDMDWVWEEYGPAGALVLIVAKPKTGKTTLTYQMAKSVCEGWEFLGRPTTPGGVLIIAPEEHNRDIGLRLQALGCEQNPNLYIRSGAIHPSQSLLSQIADFVKEHSIKLVIIDTLSTFWTVKDENDAAAVTKAVKPLLSLARESGACILLIHHSRKSEGSHGDEIRGSSALFGLVDIAITMKQHTVMTQRRLNAMSRYPETPSELIIELGEQGYVALGEPSALSKQARIERVKTILSESPQDADVISKSAGVSSREGQRILKGLVDAKEALRIGEGIKGDPFRYQRNSNSCSPQLL